MKQQCKKKTIKTGRNRQRKQMLAGILSVFLLMQAWLLPLTSVSAFAAEEVPVSSESVILMETESGTVLTEKNADTARPIASVTKIMTLLLIFEALDSGKLNLTDTVTVSEYAASMGGSQVFLEAGETQDVDTMIKCISISSANDACVAMAEHLAGSEAAFVERMNERAGELGMNHTKFLNCCGLDVAGHVSTARDVALMSAELMKNHPDITKYTTTWMDTIIHNTRRGASEFGLANTNKLIKQYNGITGLKTGSTDAAKYCLSATAERNGIKLVAVVLAAPDTKTRFREAAALLDYGFAKCVKYTDDGADFSLTEVSIEKGEKAKVSVKLSKTFQYVFTAEEKLSDIQKEVVLSEHRKAPVNKGDVLGKYQYKLNGVLLGEINIVSCENVEKLGFGSTLTKCRDIFFKKELVR